MITVMWRLARLRLANLLNTTIVGGSWEYGGTAWWWRLLACLDIVVSFLCICLQFGCHYEESVATVAYLEFNILSCHSWLIIRKLRKGSWCVMMMEEVFLPVLPARRCHRESLHLLREPRSQKIRKGEIQASLREIHQASLREIHQASLRESHQARLRESHQARLRESHQARLREIHQARLREIHRARLREIHQARLQVFI